MGSAARDITQSFPARETIVPIIQSSGCRGQLSFAYACLIERVSKLQETARGYSVP